MCAYTPPPFFHWKFCSVHFLLLFLLVFPIGAWAQGDGSLQLVLPQNLVEGRNQIDLSQGLSVNALPTIFKEHGSSGDIPSEFSLEDDGNGTDTATNVGGSEGIHVTISPNADPPDPPSYLQAFGGPTSIDLYWRAPDDNGGSAIKGYHIEYSADGVNNWTSLFSELITGGEFISDSRGIASGATYYYRVLAVNSDDERSRFSNIASATTGAPGYVAGLTATATGRNQIALEWTAPVLSGTSAITGYRIWRSLDDQVPWRELVPNTSGTGTTSIDGAVDAGTKYYYRVAAINSTGVGFPSLNEASATTDASAPDVPRNLTATASGPTRIVLSWTVPNDNGGVPITGYQIESSADGTDWPDDPLVANTGNNKTTYTDAGLTEGTTR